MIDDFSVPLYIYPIIVYFGLYILFYFVPFIRRVVSEDVKVEADELSRRIQLEVHKEKKGRTSGHEGENVVVEEKKQDPPADEEEPDVASDERSDTEEKSSENEDEKEGLIKGEHISRTLQSSFNTGVVSQAVQRLRTNYPHGNFREFDLDKLPVYAAYAERLTAARNMSGMFVLVGLLGTMIKLNTIVQQIGDAAGVSTQEATTFLDDMGLIMSNIGGAFLSSIYGLALMILFLVTIGLFDRRMQGHLDRLDHVIKQDLIPGLATLQLIKAPNLSMGDLISETSTLLSELNHTVDGLTKGMQGSLSKLGEKIESMMQDFGSFQKQYAELNTLIVQLQRHADNIEDVTDAIRGAGQTLTNPISEMNHDLNHTIREHMGVVGGAIKESERNREALATEFSSMRRDVQSVLGEVKSLVRTTLENADDHQQNMAKQIKDQIRMIEAKTESIESQMEATANALEAASSQQLRGILEDLDRGMTSASSKLLQSAVELQHASRGIEQRAKTPHSLFEWVHRTVDGRIKNNSSSKA